MFKKAFGLLQQIGKSLMLPVSVLPAAGILLGVGSAKFSWMPELLSQVMARSGGAIFGNLPLIFAIGVALGLSGNDGVSALAAVVGYVVMLGTLGVMASARGLETKSIMGIASLDTGVFGGILIGAIAAALFNRYFRIRLPSYLGFFAGKRFVPIVTAFAALVTGVVLSVVWPPVQQVIQSTADYAAYGNPSAAVTLYGFVERLLIPFGLHHIWNVPFFTQMGSFTVPGTTEVVHGDIERFFKGDPTAGILGGGYLFKMWGLPAAAIAMWHVAKKERRAETQGIMVSAALTSFLTGITEPIEFTFMFVAPLLYLAHAVLVGAAFLVMQLCGTHMGFTFSQGFIDYALYYPLDTRPWLVLVIGPLYGVLYYGLFRWAIATFDLKTPGREESGAAPVVDGAGDGGGLASQVLAALGGSGNLTNLDACITRLRVGLVDVSKAQPERLKTLGAAGVMSVGNGLQAIFGTMSENLKTDIEQLIARGGVTIASSQALSAPAAPSAAHVTKDDRACALRVAACLGGLGNVRAAEAVALTRVRIAIQRPVADDAGLMALDMPAMRIDDVTWHLVVGQTRADGLAAALREAVERGEQHTRVS